MNIRTKFLWNTAAAVALTLPLAAAAQETVNTRIGSLDFTHSFTTG